MLNFLKRKQTSQLDTTAVETRQFPMVDGIGLAAGEIWGVLAAHGETDLSSLVAQSPHSHDEVLLGIGWLAREGKIKLSGSHIALVSNECCSVA